jgi:hypothetical protein
MRENDQGGRNMIYTMPEKEKGARTAGKTWNISSSESEDEAAADSDDSCDSLDGIEKEELLDGTRFASSRMHLVSGLPINAFTSNSPGKSSANHGSATDCSHGASCCRVEAPAAALDLSNVYYIEKQLQARHNWGSENLHLKSQWLQQQVLRAQFECARPILKRSSLLKRHLIRCVGACCKRYGRRALAWRLRRLQFQLQQLRQRGKVFAKRICNCRAAIRMV